MAFWHFMRTTKGLGENTAKRRFGRCREICSEAMELERISGNPFALRSIKVSVGAASKIYVPEETIEQVIESIPSDRNEWRLLFAFGRFLGVRMPSEIQNLRWQDINFEANTVLIRDVKRKKERLVPIFPLLAPHLRVQFENAEAGEIYIFPELRRHTNLSTTATKFVERLGLPVWDKFWNTLRASCETDFMDTYGLRKACQWIGNSPIIAMKHYALMKKSDYIDAGEITVPKSDAASARMGSQQVASQVENPIKTGVLTPSNSRGGTRTRTRIYSSQDFKSCASAISPLGHRVTFQCFCAVWKSLPKNAQKQF